MTIIEEIPRWVAVRNRARDSLYANCEALIMTDELRAGIEKVAEEFAWEVVRREMFDWATNKRYQDADPGF